ncbi:MAG: glycosyltransferase family 4 protein [Planctomycetota bacterium]
MRAVHIVTRLNVGGIARFLDAGRDAVDVLIRGVVERSETEASWSGEQVVLEDLRRAPGWRDGRALRGLTRVLARLQPDVVHTHASKAGALGRFAARRLGVPCVHTFHGHVLRDYPGSAFYRLLERRLAPWARLTATGPETARELRSILRAEVDVLAPGVALPAPRPDARALWRRRWGDPERVALWVGRSAAVKRPGAFVEAAKAAGFLPVMAGTTGVPGALCLGVVDRIEEIYAAADVVVCSSRREGTPYSVLEAMWCGLPVVARPVGDVPWVLGDAGVLTDDLAAALRSVPASLGERAARRVREQFPAEQVAPRLRALYAAMV